MTEAENIIRALVLFKSGVSGRCLIRFLLDREAVKGSLKKKQN